MSLKKRLYEEYNGFSDKRIKDLNRSDTFTVDDRRPDRGQGDFGADRKLFHWFCEIYVTTLDDYSVKVEFIGGVPSGAEMTNVLTSWNTKVNDSHVAFVVDENSTDRLQALATALNAIVAPGRHYPVNWYKHTCPRVAKSLLRLKSVLDDYWTNPPAHRLLKIGTIF